MKNCCIISLFLLTMACSGRKSGVDDLVIDEVKFEYSELTGLEKENGVCRRDPSDVILVDGWYYVWYTKTEKQYSGYDATIWYAASKDGTSWQERGEALERGEKGSWDAYSVFTPNILKAEDRYYLFYTGVKPTEGNPEGKFENNSENDFTAIGVAVAVHPDSSFIRTSHQPLLSVGERTVDFDSYRVDDACLIFRDGNYYLYYKGRSKEFGTQGPRHTKLGLAIAEHPSGPYQKCKDNPLINSGHEVMVWPNMGGILALISGNGPEGKTLQYAPDAIHFHQVASFGDDYPKAPGAYRIGDFKNATSQKEGISWGISMIHGNKEQWPYLVRYEININNQ